MVAFCGALSKTITQTEPRENEKRFVGWLAKILLKYIKYEMQIMIFIITLNPVNIYSSIKPGNVSCVFYWQEQEEAQEA